MKRRTKQLNLRENRERNTCCIFFLFYPSVSFLRR